MGLISEFTGNAGKRRARQAAASAAAEAKQAFGDAKGYLSPYGDVGRAGLTALAQGLGLPFETLHGAPPEAPNRGDFTKQVRVPVSGASGLGNRGFGGKGAFRGLRYRTESVFDEDAYNQAQAEYQDRLAAYNTAADAWTSGPAFGGLNFDPARVDVTRDPGYAFRRDQGARVIDRGAAAGGKALSGQTLKALAQFGQDLASQEYAAAYQRALAENQQRYGRLAELMARGQGIATNLANLRTGNAAQLGGIYQTGAQMQNEAGARGAANLYDFAKTAAGAAMAGFGAPASGVSKAGLAILG